MNRRHFILGTVAAAVATSILKPGDNGAPYNDYFLGLNEELKSAGNYVPTMLVDLDKLDKNIAALQSQLNTNTDFRIVAKSLPSPELLGYIMVKAHTNKLMVFHQPFINDIANRFPDSDLLVGKPMPVKAAERFYQLFESSASNFKPEQQLQWLIDTPARAEQYLLLAKQRQTKLLLNVELDVGLHRGGLKQISELEQILQLVETNSEFIEFTGFMGYDPHVVKLPSIIKSQEQAYLESQQIYQQFINHLYDFNSEYKNKPLTFNGAGSPTIALHQVTTVCNELSAGSCLVKPTDFDIPSLTAYEPAAYIATPVVKKMSGTEIPAIEFAKDLLPVWDPNLQQTFFLYGGKWMANYESPKGMQLNGLYGASTNQQIVNGSYQVDLNVDDHVFLRPNQSEFVFLQFGNIVAVRAGKQQTSWPILTQEQV